MFVATDDQNYKDIASAIRSQCRSSATYKPSEMADAINSIPSVFSFSVLRLEDDVDNTSGSLPTKGQKTMNVTAGTQVKYVVFVIDYVYNSASGLKSAYAVVITDSNGNIKTSKQDGINIVSTTKTGSIIALTYSYYNPSSGYTGKISDKTITLK